MKNVAIVGASDKVDRYSYLCMNSLVKHNHNVFLVAPGKKEIEGRVVYDNLTLIEDKIDTVTMYIGPQRQSEVISQILEIKPKRVIFNPGTENDEAYAILESSGIQVIEACTLVMLSTSQF